MSVAKELSKEDIKKYLRQLNAMLKDENKHGEIVLVGGAALALVFNARNSTRDIDAWFGPKEEMRHMISAIAKNNDLPQDWLNDGAKSYITSKMNKNVYEEHSNLIVYNVDAEGLLAMKLTAHRPNSKDMEDSVFLMKAINVERQEEIFAIIEKYTYPQQQQPAAKYFAMEAFERYQKMK